MTRSPKGVLFDFGNTLVHEAQTTTPPGRAAHVVTSWRSFAELLPD